jgi:hypothetical protein
MTGFPGGKSAAGTGNHLHPAITPCRWYNVAHIPCKITDDHPGGGKDPFRAFMMALSSR